MRKRRLGLMMAAMLLAGTASAQRVNVGARILPPPTAPGEAVRPFVSVAEPLVALRHVRVIDGTGAAPVEDQTVVIRQGKIAAVQSSDDKVPDGARFIDLTGFTVLPGLVGMHDHLYYIARPDLAADGHSEAPLVVPQMTFSAPRLYLAMGVTTMRTTGSVEPYADLNLKADIDAGKLPGPHMDVTAPYLEGGNSPFIQMHRLRDADDARTTVAFWADQGATSFKAYMNINRAELRAAIAEAHRRGLKVTGHLCAVTYPEAAALGIDNLEHGFWVDTEFDPGKQPDTCPDTAGGPTIERLVPGSADADKLIQTLVKARVAVTSTLPVRETWSPGWRGLSQAALDVLTPAARNDYYLQRDRILTAPAERREANAKRWANALGMERAFWQAGGLLLAGPDPTGAGNVLPGFGDVREVELLVDAGFTPVEAIRIATLNGATYLGVSDRIGSIAVGKNADLVVVAGNPAEHIGDLEQVRTVFKDGVGYDTAALLASVKGRYGQY